MEVNRPQIAGWSGHERSFRFLGWIAWAAGLAAAAPLLGVLLVAFGGRVADWRGVSDYAVSSLVLALSVASLIAPIGTLAAWLVVRYRFPGRAVFNWALALPLAVPVFALAHAYADLLDVAGPVRSGLRAFPGWSVPFEIRSMPGAVMVLSCAFYPYVFLSMKAAFRQQSGAALEAAQSLGAGPRLALIRVAWPMAWPALAAGVALGVMETLADYGAVYFLSVQTLTTAVVRAWSVDGSVSAAAQFALPLLVFAVGLMWFERLMRAGRRFTASAGWRPMKVLNLSPLQAGLATLFCGAILTVSLLIPVGWLLIKALGVEPDVARLVRAAMTSLSLGVSGSCLTVVLAVCLAIGARGRPLLLRLSSVGYAAPGAVIAIGLLAPVSLIWRFGQGEVQIVLSLSLLLFAYCARLMAAAVEPIDGGLERITPSIMHASASLGRDEAQTAWSVQLPLASGACLAAMLIVFVDIMKELPATLMLRPFNFDTLAVISSHYALDERLGQAAWPSLLILVLSVPAVIWLSSAGASYDPKRRISL